MRLITVLEHQVEESDSSLSEVRDQIERNLRYFALEPIGNEQKGRSHYVSPDVLDYVQSKKALFTRTFLSTRQVVKFVSGGNTPFGEAEAKTAYVNKVLSKANKTQLFHDLWHDAFTSKKCTLLAEWRLTEETETVNVPEPQPQQAIVAAASQDPQVISLNLDNTDITMVQGQPFLSGEVGVVKEVLEWSLHVCAPEHVYRDPEADSIQECMWFAFEQEIPRGTLLRQGYNREQVEGLNPEKKWRSDEVKFSRSAHDGSYVATHKTNRDKNQENILVYKTWTWMNLAEYSDELDQEFADEVLLYEIHWSASEILMWEDGSLAVREVDEIPVFEWSELRLSHAANGMCGADVMAHTQKVNSSLKRAVIDNQNQINTSRYEAVYDNLLNPRDLIDNKTGGVIFTEALNSVKALEQPQLSPLTFNVLEMMKQDSEARSGLSSLTKGMNTAVLENQNAKDMVERLTNAAGARPGADAKSFADTFLVPLFKYICKCAAKYDLSQDQTEAAGQMIPIVPGTWAGKDDEVEVSVALTPEETQAHGQFLLTMHQIIANDPELSPLYTVSERHALIDDAFDTMGVSDTQRYLKRPDSPEVQQMNAQLQEAMDMVQALQAQVQELQQGVIREQLDQQWAQINNVIMDKLEDNDRADRELNIDARQGDRKLDIELAKVRGSQ